MGANTTILMQVQTNPIVAGPNQVQDAHTPETQKESPKPEASAMDTSEQGAPSEIKA